MMKQVTLLLCKDDEVAAFVEDIQRKTKHVRVSVFNQII